MTEICIEVHFGCGGQGRGVGGRQGCREEQCILVVESTATFAIPPASKSGQLPHRRTESVTARR